LGIDFRYKKLYPDSENENIGTGIGILKSVMEKI
jgi:hypothetical protein